MQSTLYLLGLPGSGKTYLGREAATLLDVPFYDLDHFVELREGKTIAEIFEEMGDDQFRWLENKYLLEMIALPSPKVVALGGGTPCYFNNMDLIRVSGISIYLKVPFETLVHRLLPEADKRPLLKGKGAAKLQTYLQELNVKRESFYKRADYTIEGGEITAKGIIGLIK